MCQSAASRRTEMTEALLLMEGIEKSFPGVHALSGCRFELRSGGVHALVGENGAGKSTLMKVLAGGYSKDAGRLRYKGAEVEIPSPRAAPQLGVSMIHQELKQISDRITVMRDGKYVDTVATQEASIGQIIGMMVGRTIYETAREVPDKPSTEIALEARGLRRGRIIKDVSFQLRRGEILGFAGLVGAGRTEVARAVFGADPLEAGEIFVQGKRIQIRSPSDAVRAGIAYLSEDRKRYGLALGMDVETNLVLTAMKRFLGLLGWVQTSRTRENGDRFVRALRIRTPGLQQRVRNLSGGNQQKVVVGKWLTADTNVLIFDEPTRGIDVGAKSEIYRLLNDLAKQGKSIIMISSELPELLRMSHRILIMCEGRITGELRSGASQEEIMRYATQRSDVIHAGATAPVL